MAGSTCVSSLCLSDWRKATARCAVSPCASHQRASPFGLIASRLDRSRLSGPVCLRSSSWHGQKLLQACTNGSRWRASQWIENSASTDVDVPLEEAWVLWDDREQIPTWMPWISSVKVLEENPKQSTWTLQTTQFGREWTLSWVAQNLTPIPNQKIHWHSVPGTNSSGIEVNNRGSIRFYRTGPTSCNITLTISYEVPQVLAPFANALQPIVESILGPDMERFAKHAVAVSPSNAREPQE
mmetsp:Transcript_28364/g.80069  ORF Transcript_28364/g.80069 Transcript_28364/m.80069 type:complete len:240 (-) Transcript_28364:344-1063(-)